MVEAVSSINLATKTYMQKKKNEDIAWEKLTPSQILQYMNQGEDVPEEIKRWAEEVNKLQDIPDDVTYASVNGASTTDEINDENSQSDEPDAEDAASKVTMTQAQQFRQSMELSGESKYEQAKALSNQSKSATKSEEAMETRLDQITQMSEATNMVIEVKARATEKKTSSMKQELDNLLAKAQSNDQSLSPADLNRIAELGGILTSIGTEAQADLAQIGTQLAELDVEMQQFEAIPATATDFGTETVAIGAELVTDDANQQAKITEAANNSNGINTAKVAMNATKLKLFSMLFNRNYRMGINSIKDGGHAMEAGANGVAALDYAKSELDEKFTHLGDAQSRVEGNTGVEGIQVPRAAAEQPNGQTDESGDTTNNNDLANTEDENKKSEEVKTASSKTGETDVKDSTLVVDTDELKKRRAEKGLA